MRRYVLLVSLVVAATMARPSAAPAKPAKPAKHAELDARAAAQKVLDTRVAAVLRGDRDGFLATVDPEAPPAFRMTQGQSFDGLRSLPLASYQLTVRLEGMGDLGVTLSDRHGGARTFLPETRQTIRFRDYDDRDAVDSLWLSFVERRGRWYVASDSDLSDVGLDSARGLWDQGAVRVARTPHFLLLSHPEQAARADALGRIAEEAIGTMAQRWSRPWSQKIPLVLPSSKDELATVLQSSFDLDNFVAFVVYGSVRDRGWDATAPRIYIQDENLNRYAQRFQLQTLTHELTHAATASLAGPFIPSWVHEGVADWIGRGQFSEPPPKGSDGRLPQDYEFSTGGATSIVGAYDESRSAISKLALVGGRDAPARLFELLGKDRIAPGDNEAHVERAMRELTGRGFEDFQRGWAGQQP